MRTRRVNITITVETDEPIEVLQSLNYAETRRPCPYWFEPEDEREPDDCGDYHPHSIPILAVRAEEVKS